MFDRLIESNSAEAEFKPRRKFFMVSSVVVGIMFLSAVMISLYAQDLDLGTDEFELSAIMAPVPPDAPEPEPPRQQPQSTSEQRSDVPSRPDLIARAADSYDVPDAISTTPNSIREIPRGPVKIGIDMGDPVGSSRSVGSTVGTGSASDAVATETEVVERPAPPPIPKAEPKKPVTQTKGVVNGFATYLPKPPYSPLARSTGVTGSVNVQVLINEAGDVVSAKAIDGHPFFKVDAERAAKNAKFKPTFLGDQPVRVTGVIVYRFTK